MPPSAVRSEQQLTVKAGLQQYNVPSKIETKKLSSCEKQVLSFFALRRGWKSTGFRQADAFFNTSVNSNGVFPLVVLGCSQKRSITNPASMAALKISLRV